jgi:serine/threonine protein phosphatase PrpC
MRDVANRKRASHVFTEESMHEAQVLPFAGGQVAVYSARSPDKTSPNEDAAALLPLSTRDGAEDGVLVVADGLGGQPGGASAAQIAVRCLEKALAAPPEDDRSVRGAILDGFEHANRSILELGIGAGTTLMAAELRGRILRPYHVGDSALLVAGQRGKLKLQTLSHSPVGYAVESGLLDEDEALHHEERHLLSNLVGAADMRIEIGSPLALAARDTVLLATDGLFDNQGVREILDTIRTGPLSAAAGTLARVCRERMQKPTEGRPSKPDDLTFVLYRRR